MATPNDDITLNTWLAIHHLAAILRQLPPCPYLQGADRLEELARIVAGLHRAAGITGVDVVPLETLTLNEVARQLRQVLRTLQVEREGGRERVLSLTIPGEADAVICMTSRQFTALLRPSQGPP